MCMGTYMRENGTGQELRGSTIMCTDIKVTSKNMQTFFDRRA